uniref:Uncharacterized protein n=1 Tax=Spongospora subterranea TaxID=70186 RepID=A0A0H5RE87_9EUKA|eukprot:CRZ06882.1 hypothetical protein [Spongospora subterranea]
MPGIPTVDKLVSSYPGYPDLTQWESEYILDSTFESKFHYIRTYLVEDRGLRYNENLIEEASERYCKGIYHYVLDHLLPELDKAAMTAKYPVKDPPDHQFLFFILCYCWPPDRVALKDLFFGRPEMIPKIVHVINFLSRTVFQSNHCIARSPITKFELQIQQHAEPSATTFEAAAQSICDVLTEVLPIMGDAGYQGFTDIDWSIEGDVDFNDQPEYMRS